MFTTEELQSIDRNYFIHNVELADRNLCLVYHKHHISHLYHSHSRCGTLRRAIRDIKSHDKFQLNGRKPVYKH